MTTRAGSVDWGELCRSRRSVRVAWVAARPAALAGLVALVVACGGKATQDRSAKPEDVNFGQRHDVGRTAARPDHAPDRETASNANDAEAAERGTEPAMAGPDGEDGPEIAVAPCEIGDLSPTAQASLPPPVVQFEATLAPRWHAEVGAKRTAETCAAVPALRDEAQAIASSAPPGGLEPAAWTVIHKRLSSAIKSLDAACKANDTARFEFAFTLVHNNFHSLMGAASGGRARGHGSESGEPSTAPAAHP